MGMAPRIRPVHTSLDLMGVSTVRGVRPPEADDEVVTLGTMKGWLGSALTDAFELEAQEDDVDAAALFLNRLI